MCACLDCYNIDSTNNRMICNSIDINNIKNEDEVNSASFLKKHLRSGSRGRACNQITQQPLKPKHRNTLRKSWLTVRERVRCGTTRSKNHSLLRGLDRTGGVDVENAFLCQLRKSLSAVKNGICWFPFWKKLSEHSHRQRQRQMKTMMMYQYHVWQTTTTSGLTPSPESWTRSSEWNGSTGNNIPNQMVQTGPSHKCKCWLHGVIIQVLFIYHTYTYL